MLTNTELDAEKHPLRHAHAIQLAMERLQMDLAGLQTEYNQLILYCKEKGIERQDGYTVSVKTDTRRKIDPELFARTFPDANNILVQKQAAFMGTELDKLVQTHILPAIKIEDAKELVGNFLLDKTCVISVTEKVKIVKERTE